MNFERSTEIDTAHDEATRLESQWVRPKSVRELGIFRSALGLHVALRFRFRLVKLLPVVCSSFGGPAQRNKRPPLARTGSDAQWQHRSRHRRRLARTGSRASTSQPKIHACKQRCAPPLPRAGACVEHRPAAHAFAMSVVRFAVSDAPRECDSRPVNAPRRMYSARRETSSRTIS